MTQNYFDEWMRDSRRAARLTGLMSGMVKYSFFPDDVKLHIIKMLIDEYTENPDDSKSHSSWVKEWEELKAELEIKIKNTQSNG